MKNTKGTKFLSEAIHEEDLESGALNLIRAPVGCGKTYWATHSLCKRVKFKDKMLYLIDTINGRDQLISSGLAKSCDEFWLSTTMHGGVLFFDSGIPIMTYARFGSLVNKNPLFSNHFDIILCDEIHNLIRFDSFAPSIPEDDIRYCKIAKDELERIIVNRSQALIVGLSATPEIAQQEFKCPINQISVDEDIREYEVGQILEYSNIEYLAKSIDQRKTGIIYTGHISQMLKIQDILQLQGIPSVPIWSIRNQDYKMSEAQLSARKYILNNERLPPEYRAVIINASCETSINIKSEVDYMIIHSREKEVQIQVRGRYRDDLPQLYLYNNDSLQVPQNFLNRKLFKSDKDELCSILNYQNKSSNVYKWTSVKKRLPELGYTIKEGRDHNLRYAVISI